MKRIMMIAAAALMVAGCHKPQATVMSNDAPENVSPWDQPVASADDEDYAPAQSSFEAEREAEAETQAVKREAEADKAAKIAIKPAPEVSEPVKVEVKPAPEVEAPEVVETPTEPETVDPVVEAPLDPIEEETKPEPVVITPIPAGDETVALGRRFFAEGDLRNARAAFTVALSNDLSYEEEKETLETLDLINVELLTSTGADGDLIEYRVKSGDTLAKIARAYSTTYQMIQRLNGLTSQTIRIGQRLNVPNAAFSLIVRKDKFVMDLLIDGQFVKRYKVGLGKNDCTPVGNFTIFNRIPHPADGSYPYGHPEHRIGSHWMGMRGDNGYEGYGIHGCRVEEYDMLGGECSRGCVRVTNEDAEELFSILPVNTQVTVVE